MIWFCVTFPFSVQQWIVGKTFLLYSRFGSWVRSTALPPCSKDGLICLKTTVCYSYWDSPYITCRALGFSDPKYIWSNTIKYSSKRNISTLAQTQQQRSKTRSRDVISKTIFRLYCHSLLDTISFPDIDVIISENREAFAETNAYSK